MRLRFIAVSLVTTACILHTNAAHAGGYGLSGTFWFETAGSFMPNSSSGAPSFAVSDTSSSVRSNINGSTPAFGFATGFFGVRSGLDFVASDRWIIPVLGIGAYGIIGVYSDTLTSADGSIFKLHPAGAMLFDADILGIGVRFKHRRWMFEGTLKPGLAMLIMPASIADGKGFTDVDSLTAVTPTLRANLSVCRRLDPADRLCASATANIYEWGWGNGGSIGLRWEFGS